MGLRIRKSDLNRRFTKLAIIVCLVGFSFPIYGLPGFGGLKLTFWRLGLALLTVIVLFMGLRLQSKLALVSLGFGGAFIVIRLASYLFSIAEDRNVTQLVWFVEGFIYLSIVTILASHYAWVLNFYLKAVLSIGFVSIGLMALQYLLLQRGILLTLPFSDTAFGLSSSLRPWTYPLGGSGRILGAFYEPNMSGSMCAFYIATFAPFLLAPRHHSFIRRPLWIGVLLTITLVSLFATGSRQSLVAVAITGFLIGIVAMLRGGYTLQKAIFWLCLALIAFSAIIVVNLRQPLETPFGEAQMNILARITLDAGGDVTGGRLYWIQELIEGITPYIAIFGIGEGAGILTAHNAFLIVFNQNGVFGLLLLMLFASGLFFASVRLTLSQRPSLIFFSGIASICIVATWIGLIFMNWAQLNQSLSFMYLAIPFLVFTAAQQTRTESKPTFFGKTGVTVAHAESPLC
jgi:hypothetical protein